MTYETIIPGKFLARPNRFIAHVETAAGPQVCHVKNTGRCRELLVPGATVYLEESANPGRKTKYDLVAVEKGRLLINMDSQAPNRVAEEYLPQLFPGLTSYRRERAWGSSRFDFFIEAAGERWFMEVKGVTLEEAKEILRRHKVEKLPIVDDEGFRACVLFVIQMEGIRYFTPNRRTHPEFAQALEGAAAQGVRVEAVDCHVTPSSLTPGAPVALRLNG